MKRIDSLKKYIERKGEQYIVTTDKVQCKINDRWSLYGSLDISESVTSVGVMDVEINDKYTCGLLLFANINMKPSIIEKITIDGQLFYLLTFNKGDVFINNISVVKDGDIIFKIYKEYIDGSGKLNLMKYEDYNKFLDQANEVCDANIPVDRAMLEVIYSFVFRNKDDLLQVYRHTDMKNTEYEKIPLKAYHISAKNTLSKMAESYTFDGITSALINQNKDKTLLEDIIRS